MCRVQVETEAHEKSRNANQEGDESVQALSALFAGLRAIDAPKTLILISEGFVLSDGGMIAELGTMAAEARTSLYALKLDNQLFDITDSRMPGEFAAITGVPQAAASRLLIPHPSFGDARVDAHARRKR